MIFSSVKIEIKTKYNKKSIDKMLFIYFRPKIES